MNAVSLFAGIGSFDLAAERAGINVTHAVEIDPECRPVLAAHFPRTELHEDVRTFDAASLAGRVDLILAGWPCQGNSLAGRRAGMADPRSGLWAQVVRVLADTGARWFVGENVPGLLSVNGGRDFATCLGDLAGLGMECAWRVLDAQHFGVPQRRRRVFLVGRARGAGTAPVQVLFEPEGSGGDSAAGGEAGTRVAALTANGVGICGADDNQAQAGRLIPALTTRCGNTQDDQQTGQLIPFDTTQITSHLNRSNPQPGDPSHPLAARAHPPAIAFHATQDPISGDVAPAMGTGNANGCATIGVRRLTPLECARLQGFPDAWLDGLGLSDSAKYRMLGNAVAVPVVEWVLRRLAAAA